MRILVVGGTYFLGKAFVNKMYGQHHITLLNRGTKPAAFPVRAAGEAPPVITAVTMDRHALTPGCLAEEHFDIAVDFCAYEKGDIEQVMSALDGHLQQYIFISTCDVYARGTGTPVDEGGALETRDFGGETGAYILGKAALEQELISCRERYGVHTTSVRPAFLYGPDNYAPREGIFFRWIDQAEQVICPSDTTGSFHMVFVQDAAEILCKLCGNRDAYDIALNLCGPEKVSYESFCDALAYATGRSFEKILLSNEEIQEQQVPLPFPVTAAESETYTSIYGKEDVFGISYHTLRDGLKITYRSFQEESTADRPGTSPAEPAASRSPGDLFDTIDALFDANRPKEALAFMQSELERSKAAGNDELTLSILNELIGYYRQTSEADPLLQVIDESLALADRMHLQGTVSYATTTLNAANAYRSLGRTEESKKYYDITEAVYRTCIRDGILQENDMLLAGLYNNVSLLYQERSDYRTAKQYLLKALDIATANNAGFEIAVTYANLANTSVLAGQNCSKETDADAADSRSQFDEAEMYADTAIRLFKARGLRDPHYCAALSALGTCFFERGKWRQAKAIFADALQIVEETFGKNNQYARLKGNCDMCDKMLENAPENGMELSRKYYEAYGIPMIRGKFPEYEKKIAVGLCGEGSDCFGYDDALSEDHDFGPDFCMWLDDETYDAIGTSLQQTYDELPQEFAGFRRTVTAAGRGRHGVMRISDYYKRFVGTDRYEQIDFTSVPDYALAACVNGEVFRDDAGIFTAMRTKLQQGYPAGIRLLKLAQDAAGFSQCGQYNFERFLKRGDAFTASIMLSDCMKHAMQLYHHLLNVYPPHDKWLHKSTSLLPGGTEAIQLADRIMYSSLNGENTQKIIDLIEELGSFFAMKLYENTDISDIDPYLDHHTEELLFKAGIAALSVEELAERIARLEFEAFDKVQNEGGRASCQNNWPTFSIMRRSQYLTWDREMLMQYLYDFDREYRRGHNLITEKYGRMMESTAPERYEEIKDNFPALSETKKAVIEQIVSIQMEMADALSKTHPKVISQARSLHTYEDDPEDTSYETYLRGEISTYSDKMLQLYGGFVVQAAKSGVNLAQITMENTAKLYGYKDLDAFSNDI